MTPRAAPAIHGSDVARLMQSVARLLDDNHPDQALRALDSHRDTDPMLVDARGVCLMRLGRIREAITLYRKLVLADNDVTFDLRQPTTFLTNFATALLLDRNVRGCLDLLFQIGDEGHPTVLRLREALRRWKAGLSRWHRLLLTVYGEVKRPIVLGFPPGELAALETSGVAGRDRDGRGR